MSGILTKVKPTTQNLDGFRTHLLRFGAMENTVAQYVSKVRRAYQEDDPLDRLIEPDLSPKYLRLIRASLRSWAVYSDDKKLTKELSQIRLPSPRSRHKRPILTKDQWHDLRDEIVEADYLSEPMRAELGMLINRGFRCGDVLRIRRKEVTSALKTGTLAFEGKGRRRLEFTVASAWRESLEGFADYRDWDRVEDLISPRAKEGSRRRNAAGRAVARALDTCGEAIGMEPEDLHPHLLRKTYATFYYRLCNDPKALQDHLQWASLETAMNYVEAGSRESLDAIAEKMFDNDA